MLSKDDNYRKIFSNNLNYYMKINNKIQDDLVKDLGLKTSTISSWCNGTRLPRMNKVQLLADYLNINVSDLIEGSCDNNNYFEFISEDDSMYPILDIGDIALIYKQNVIDKTDNKNKGTYLIKLNGKNTIRKFVLDKEKNVYQLIAKNTCCKTIDIPADNLYDTVQIIGKVVKAENESAFK